MAIDTNVKVVISAVDKYSGVFGDFGKNTKLLTVGALAAEVGIAALSIKLAEFSVKLGSEAVTAAADFNDAIFDISAVAGPAGASVAQIGTILDDTVAKFPVTGKQAGEALESIAQFGFSSAESLKTVSDAALTLRIATGSELQTAVSGLTATLQQFGIASSEVDRVSNLFAKTQFTSAASVSDLREALKFAGPTAAVFGQGLEETVAVLAQLRNNGLDASQTGTVLRQTLTQLTKETDKGTESLAKYGLTYDDVNPSTKSYVEILEAFQGQTVSAADAVNIFGVRQLAFVDLINKGAQGVKDYTKEITGTDAAVTAAATKSEKFSVVIDNLGGTFDVFKKTIGEGFLPVLIDVIGKDENSGIRGVIGQLQKLEKEQGTIGGPLIEAFGAIKQAVNNIFTDAFQGDIKNVFELLSKLSDFLGTNIKIIANFGEAFATVFAKSAKDGDLLEQALKIINGAFTALSFSVAIVADGIQGLIVAGNLGFAGLNKILEQVVNKFKGVAEIANKLPFVELESEIKQLENAAKVFGETAKESFDKTKNVKFFTTAVIEGSAESATAINKFAENSKKALKDIESQKLDINTEPIKNKIADLEAALDGVEKFEIVGEFVNKNEVEKELNDLKNFLSDVEEQKINIDIDTKNFEEDSKKIVEDYNNLKEDIEKAVISIPFETEEAREEFKKTLETSKEIRDEVLKTWKEGEQERVNNLAKAEQERVKIIKEGAKEQIKTISETLERREDLLEDTLSNLALLEAEGGITTEEATKTKLEAEENFYKEQLKLAEKNLEAISTLYTKDTDEYKTALDEQRNAQAEFTNFKINKIEEEAQLAKDALQQETDIRKAELDIQLANIKNAELSGVISTQEASNQKIEAEKAFAQAKIDLTEQAVDLAIQQYGEDSVEYKQAVAERINAENEFAQKKVETEETIKRAVIERTQIESEANRKINKESLAGRKGTKQIIAKTGEELDRAIAKAEDFRKKFAIPNIILLEADEAVSTLDDLNKIQEENFRSLAETADARWGVTQDYVRQQIGLSIERTETLRQQFEVVGNVAKDAGLNVDLFGKTLGELQADIESRIEGWENFKEAIGGVTSQSEELRNEYTNLGGTIEQTSVEAAAGFQDIVKSSDDLRQNIEEVNKAFGKGAIEDAEALAEGVIESYEEIYDQATEILDNLKSEWEDLGDKIEEINGKIIDIESSTQDAIREARRATFTEEELFQDKRLEFQEVYAQAQEAQAQGAFDVAVGLFEKAADIAGDLQGEVKDESGNVVRTLEQTTTESISLMEKASNAAIEALNQQQSGLANQQQLIGTQINQTVGSLQSLQQSFQGIVTDTEKATQQMQRFNSAIPANPTSILNFQGTGSPTKPLSEKIDELSGKLRGFNKEIEDNQPKITGDFAGLRKGFDDTLALGQQATTRGGAARALGTGTIDDSNVLKVDFPSIGDISKQAKDTNKLFSQLSDGTALIPSLIGASAGGGSGAIGIDTSSIVSSIEASFNNGIDKLLAVFDKLKPADEVTFDVSVTNQNGRLWLDNLITEMINEIFSRARSENLLVFGREN